MQAKCNNTIKRSMAFTATIFVELVLTSPNYVDISCTDVYTNRARSMEITGINLFTPLSHWPDMYKIQHMLDSLLYIRLVRNFMEM
jgi:hypothetical protein